MKKIISAALILTVVGIALAFKTKDNPDIRLCPNGVCIAQATWSTIDPGTGPVDPGQKVYVGTVGAPCPSVSCPEFHGNVYVNE